jgi:LEA14-like dessication related protein
MKIRYGLILMTVAVLMLNAGCQTVESVLAFKKPKASLIGLRFGEITLTSADIMFNVEIENPYSVSMPLTNMDYALSTSDKPLLSGKAKLASIIDAKSSKVITLPATISYREIAKAFSNIMPGSQIPYKADLGLSVDTPVFGTILLPLTRQGQISVPSIPKLNEINWEKIIEKIP